MQYLNTKLITQCAKVQNVWGTLSYIFIIFAPELS